MKALAWISLAMGIGIAIYEGVIWYGKSELAPVIIALAIAITLQSAYSVFRK